MWVRDVGGGSSDDKSTAETLVLSLMKRKDWLIDYLESFLPVIMGWAVND